MHAALSNLLKACASARSASRFTKTYPPYTYLPLASSTTSSTALQFRSVPTLRTARSCSPASCLLARRHHLLMPTPMTDVHTPTGYHLEYVVCFQGLEMDISPASIARMKEHSCFGVGCEPLVGQMRGLGLSFLTFDAKGISPTCV